MTEGEKKEVGGDPSSPAASARDDTIKSKAMMRLPCARGTSSEQGRCAWLAPVVGASVEILRFAQDDTKNE